MFGRSKESENDVIFSNTPEGRIMDAVQAGLEDLNEQDSDIPVTTAADALIRVQTELNKNRKLGDPRNRKTIVLSQEEYKILKETLTKALKAQNNDEEDPEAISKALEKIRSSVLVSQDAAQEKRRAVLGRRRFLRNAGILGAGILTLSTIGIYIGPNIGDQFSAASAKRAEEDRQWREWMVREKDPAGRVSDPSFDNWVISHPEKSETQNLILNEKIAITKYQPTSSRLEQDKIWVPTGDFLGIGIGKRIKIYVREFEDNEKIKRILLDVMVHETPSKDFFQEWLLLETPNETLNTNFVKLQNSKTKETLYFTLKPNKFENGKFELRYYTQKPQ